jgi:hypothetical protein
MNNINNSCNNEEETKLIFSSLLTNRTTKVLLMRQQHLANLNRERVGRYSERKRQGNTNGYVRKVREKKQKD